MPVELIERRPLTYRSRYGVEVDPTKERDVVECGPTNKGEMQLNMYIRLSNIVDG